MVRETRHLWVGNLPENIPEERVFEHFKRYGRVQSIKLLPGGDATVSFNDIKSAAKAHEVDHTLDEKLLSTEYCEPSTVYAKAAAASSTASSTGHQQASRFPPISISSSEDSSQHSSSAYERSTSQQQQHLYDGMRGGSSTPGSPLSASGADVGGGGFHPRRTPVPTAYHGGIPSGADSLRGRPRERLYRNGPPYLSPTERVSSGNHRRSWPYDSPSANRYAACDLMPVPSQSCHDTTTPPPSSTPLLTTASSSPSSALLVASGASVSGSNHSGKVRKPQLQCGSSESRSGSQSSRSRSPARSSPPLRSPVRSPLRSPPRSPAGRSSSASTRSSRSSEPPSSSPRSADGKALRVSAPTTSSAATGTAPINATVSTNATITTLPVYSEDGRPLAICVRDLPIRSSDSSLKDGLFHEYKKHGKVTWVKVVGTAGERYALVCFKKPEDVDKAIEVSQDKFFFGCKIDVAPYHGYDVEDNETRPYDAEHDEYHPKATRTLFIGNLSKDVTERDIWQHFDQFGEIIEVDLKKPSPTSSSSTSASSSSSLNASASATAGGTPAAGSSSSTQYYAFCQFAEISSVVRAIRALDGELLGDTRLKLGFGKSMAVSCVWVAGISEQIAEKQLHAHFVKFGTISRLLLDRTRAQALIFYDQVPSATMAVKEMRGVSLRGRRIQIDYASRECQETFQKRLEHDRDTASWGGATAVDERRYDVTTANPLVTATTSSSSSSSRMRGYSRSQHRSSHYAGDSPRHRSFEDLSPAGSDDELMTSPNAIDLNYLHKRRDNIQKLLRLDVREREKSRPPARSVTAADQGLVVTTHNHRRRLSTHRRSSGESTAAPLSKRRKTGSTSEDERRRPPHHSGDDSRPGTPLIDELPDQHNRPKEPRRAPQQKRSSDEPMSLPLPPFAANCFAVVQPQQQQQHHHQQHQQTKQSPMRPRSPIVDAPSQPAFTPASPSRPQSPLSSSSSVVSPRESPSLEEQLRSFDEKFENWASRTQPPVITTTTTKPRHHLLDVDVGKLKPSDIVKSVLAKRSVFDEDSKRLENVNDKYEPKDFSTFQRLEAKLTSLLSPRSSTGSASPSVKGLQYPFPSHPPVWSGSGSASGSANSGGSAGVGQQPPAKIVSQSYQLSLQKAESWLGISKQASEYKDTSGFTLRYQPRYLNDLPNNSTSSAPPPPPPPPSSSSPSLASMTATTTTLANSTLLTKLSDPRLEKTQLPATNSSLTSFPPKLITQRLVDSKPEKPATMAVPPPPPPPPPPQTSAKVQPAWKSAEDNRAQPPLPSPSISQKTHAQSENVHTVGESRKEREVPVTTTLTDRNCEKPAEIGEVLLTLTSDKLNLSNNNNNNNNVNSKDSPSLESTKHQIDSTKLGFRSSQSHNNNKKPTDSSDSSNALTQIADHKSSDSNESSSKVVSYKLGDNGLTAGYHHAHGKIVDEPISEKSNDKCKFENEQQRRLPKEKLKERESTENVDKEREVDNERKKDRDPLDTTEKRKIDQTEDEVEVSKKDEALDRRKNVLDKKILDHHERKSLDHHERLKKKDEDRDKKVHDKKREHGLDKHRSKSDDKRRDEKKDRDKESASIGNKRRISIQENSHEDDSSKKSKGLENKRRDSKDSKNNQNKHKTIIDRKDSSSSSSSTAKHGTTKLNEHPTEHNHKLQEVKKKDEQHEKKKHSTVEVKKSKEDPKSGKNSMKENHFKLATDYDDEKAQKKTHSKDKKRVYGSCDSLEEKKPKKEKRLSSDSKKDDMDKEKSIKEVVINGHDSGTDSDSEPKKHSIFDVVIDEPVYISMYDKVKARSTKNLQKQEEEKRQVKLKEKFSKLKQSRAKREEKKRSTSWDEDSDSDASVVRRRHRQQSAARLTSDDDDDMPMPAVATTTITALNTVTKQHVYDTSEDEKGKLASKPNAAKLRASDIYSDESDYNEQDKYKALQLKNRTHHELLDAKKNRPVLKVESKQIVKEDRSEINSVKSEKKRPCHENFSENEQYQLERERKRAKKRDKRMKLVDDDKYSDDRKKKERRKSDDHHHDEENKVKKKAKLEASHEDTRMEEIFGTLSEESNQSVQKTSESAKNSAKWSFLQVYGSDSDSPNAYIRKKEKKKKEKKHREPCKENIQDGQDLIYNQCADGVAREKKKKRKKSKDEKSSRHHHHHHHHHDHDNNSITTKIEQPALIEAPPPPLSSLIDMPSPRPPSPRLLSPPLTMPTLTKNAASLEKPAEDINDLEKQQKFAESAVRHIPMSSPTETSPKKVEPAAAVEDSLNKGTKERVVISQEETEVAVASLLGETFSAPHWGADGSPPGPETEPAAHDEQEMLQAVQSLNDEKPETPQSDADLHIDTDAEEGSEDFNSMRLDYLPKTPDVDLSAPPKTPDISPALVTSKPAFVRKDTTRNSRDDMDVPVPVACTPEKSKESPPPLLTPATPKFRDEPVIKTPEKIVLDTREGLLLVPPPLVPVSKQVPQTTPPKSIALMRPLISPTVLSNICTTPSTAVYVKKPYPSPTLVTRIPNPPPVLSPVTPCTPKLPSPTSSSPRFSTTIVSPRQVTATHIIVSRPVSGDNMPALVPAEASKNIRPAIPSQVIQSTPTVVPRVATLQPTETHSIPAPTSVIASTPAPVKPVSTIPSVPTTVLTSTGNVPPCKSEVSVICPKPIPPSEKVADLTENVAVDVKPNVEVKSAVKIEHDTETTVSEIVPNDVDLKKEEIKTQPEVIPASKPEPAVVAKEETTTNVENPILENFPQNDSVIKRTDDEEEKLSNAKKSPVLVNEEKDEKDSSSDEDKPINSLARSMKKRAGRGSGRGTRPGRGSGSRGGRGRGRGRAANDSKRLTSNDVYEFHESDEESSAANARQPLILTIKSPNNAPVSPKASSLSPKEPVIKSVKPASSPPQTATTKEPVREASPVKNNDKDNGNTRKSRRLLEKDTSKSTVDEVIEDVIRNAAYPRRSTRQIPPPTKQLTGVSAHQTTPKKGRKKVHLDEDVSNKSDEDSPIAVATLDGGANEEEQQTLPSTSLTTSTPAATASEVKEKTPMDTSSTDGNESEPTTLIDPVTGMLMVMRAKEEGKYVPVPNAAPVAPPTPPPIATVSQVVTSTHTQTTPVKPMDATTALPLNEGLGSHWLAADLAKSKTLVNEKSSFVTSRSTSPNPAKIIDANTPIRLTTKYVDAVQPKVYHQQQQESTPPSMCTSAARSLPEGITGLRVEVPTGPEPAKPLKSAKCSAINYVPSSQMVRGNPQASPHKGYHQQQQQQQQQQHQQSAHQFQQQQQSLQSIGMGSRVDVPHIYEPGKPIAAAKGSSISPMNMQQAAIVRSGRANAIVISPGSAKTAPTVPAPLTHHQPQPHHHRGLLIPATVVSSPPAHEHPHPMTGTVASPPPRAPHYASQQPVVAGASSSRTLPPVTAAVAAAAAAAARGMPPMPPSSYDAAALGEGVSLGHMSGFMPGFIYQPYLSNLLASQYAAGFEERGAGDMGHSPPLDRGSVTSTPGSYHHRVFGHHTRYLEEPPPAHLHRRTGGAGAAMSADMAGHTAHAPHEQPHPRHGTLSISDLTGQPRLQVATPPHASQVPPQADSLLGLLQNCPIMWQGLLALKNDQSSVQMYFVQGNEEVARQSLRVNHDGSTSPLRIAQRMRLEPAQLEGVARKMQTENEHCMLLALPCGRDHVDVLKQSTSLNSAFITYLQLKQAAGIVNIAHPGSQQPAYVVHIFPSCDFANENLARVAPDLLHRMQEIPHLIIVIATV